VNWLEKSRGVGDAVRAQSVRIGLFSICGILSIYFGFLFFKPDVAGEFVRKFGYFGIVFTLGWFVILGLGSFRDIRLWVGSLSKRELRWIISLITALSLISLMSVPFGYKVLYDELVLQATSWNLHRLREVGTMVRAYEVEGVFSPLAVYLDKRPYFYALLVSLMHDLFGFSENNAFILNACLYPLVLVLFYAIARRLASARVALAGLACFGANPLLMQNANGGGMDLLNLLMLLLMFLLAARYLQQPNGQRLSLVLLACVLLAQTRYESLLFVLTTGLVVLEGWRREGGIILTPTAIFTPLLLIPSALHNSYLSGTPALWELKDDMDSRFGMQYVLGNLEHAGIYFSNYGPSMLGSWWLSLCGFLALGWLIITKTRNWRKLPNLDPTLTAIGLSCLAIGANLILLMSYFWGQLDDPIVTRLILPFTAIMALAAVVVLRGFEQRFPALVDWVTAGALVVFLGWAPPASTYHGKINQLAAELVREQRIVSRMAPISRLILTEKTTLGWLVKGIPALTLKEAGNRSEQIQYHLDHGTFKEVLVTQRLRPTSTDGGFQVDPRDEMPDRFLLEPVWERMQGGRLVRISRVVEIQPESVLESEVGEMD
jgi:hypothetical protein